MCNNVFFTVNQAVIVCLIYMELMKYFVGVQSAEHIVTRECVKSQTCDAFLADITILSALLLFSSVSIATYCQWNHTCTMV